MLCEQLACANSDEPASLHTAIQINRWLQQIALTQARSRPAGTVSVSRPDSPSLPGQVGAGGGGSSSHSTLIYGSDSTP